MRYFLFSGLAISHDKGRSFKRVSEKPVLVSTPKGLYVRSAPFLLRTKEFWNMWYVEGNKWIDINKKQVPMYKIKHITSQSLTEWGTEGNECFDYKSDDEYGFGRPFILYEDNTFKMFYSIRMKSKGYRLGYSESTDGQNWIRLDEEIGITVSENGWDSEMICFSSILKFKDITYMFYNGNNYGESGIGYAILEK